MATRPRRPRDSNLLAKMIVGISTGEIEDVNPDAGKDPAAVARGRLGGLKGGVARKKSLSSRRRKQISKQAAIKRWKT